MADIIFNPYIFFPGNCAEAMEFYKGVFGGTVETSAYDDLPGDTPEGMAGKLMHASLKGGVIDLMGSDTAQASPKAAKITLSLSGDDDAKLREMFDGLSAGGNVVSPLKTESWGDTFGALTDKYGVEWMVNISTGQPPAAS